MCENYKLIPKMGSIKDINSNLRFPKNLIEFVELYEYTK